MFDEIKKEIDNLFNDLAKVEQEMEQTLSPSEEFNKLEGEESAIYENIKQKILKLLSSIAELRKDQDAMLIDVLQQMENLLSNYSDNCNELCTQLKEAHKNLVLSNENEWRQKYKNVWEKCGLGELVMTQTPTDNIPE